MKVLELIELLYTMDLNAKVRIIDENPDYVGVNVTKKSVTTNGDYVHITVKIADQDIEN